ncbi:MAG: ribosome-binding factor A [Bacteroidetes bacterium]|nr:MAG: ribosome-binding factor A [Bacteroidota bacterium]
MDSKRQLKYAKLIQKELSDIFQKDTKSLFGNAFITITRTEVSPDLSVAKNYLSFMLVNDKAQMLDSIREKTKIIRQNLGVRMRNQARIIPELELVFFLDDSAEYAIKMDSIISNLNIPKE